MRELVHPDAREEQVASGFEFTEGPIWHPNSYLMFSDIPASTRYRWTPESGITAMRSPSNKGNGMTFGVPEVPAPFAAAMETEWLPGRARITERVLGMVSRDREPQSA